MPLLARPEHFIRFDNTSPAPGQARSSEIMVFYSLAPPNGEGQGEGYFSANSLIKLERRPDQYLTET